MLIYTTLQTLIKLMLMLVLRYNLYVFATMDGVLVFILVEIDLDSEQTDRYPLQPDVSSPNK